MREGLCGTGSVPPIYTKGDTLYSSAVVAMAPRDQALRSQGSLGEEGFSRVARGGEVDRFQCSLRPDPATLRFLGAVQNRACTRRERGDRWSAARGRSHLFTQKGTLLTIQLPLRWLRRTGPVLAGNVGTGGAFALAREGE